MTGASPVTTIQRMRHYVDYHASLCIVVTGLAPVMSFPLLYVCKVTEKCEIFTCFYE